MREDVKKQATKLLSINKILSENINIATHLNKDALIGIANDVVEGYDADLSSRIHWEQDLKNWTELALQISSTKTYPWQGAANIKYPLLATAAMQFAARAYPTLVPSNGKVVKCKVIGSDQDGQKGAKAERISTHMSYQLLYEMEDWEEDMDRLLIALPIVGTCFKKTYWDTTKQVNCSKLVLPKTLVVNYWAKSLAQAERITEFLPQTRRYVREKQNQGLYLNVDIGTPQTPLDVTDTGSMNVITQEDETTPYTVLEQHSFLDLDGDGYTEPYIITVEYYSKTVLRIARRFEEDDILVDDKGKVIMITPTQYYTKYSFVPNPDGGFYDIGFGRLLGSLNNSANTIINQLVDAGTLSNLQAGFIGKGLRIRMGDSKFSPGEWKAVNATGDDIKKQIFPLPVREPSEVLFKLLDLLLKSGKELASVAEIFVGKMPGQNTPATTTMATIEQGMKVFTAVYKRVYRALTSEFRKLYKLNKEYLNPETFISVLDEPVQDSDYKGPADDIYPGADPTAVSSQEKQAKVQALMQILQLGTLDPMAVTQLYLEAHEIPEPQKYLKQPSPPPPDPKMEALKLKAQLDQQKAQTDMMITTEKAKLENATKEQEAAIKQRLGQLQIQQKQMEAILAGQLAKQQLESKMAEQQVNMQGQIQQKQLDLQASAVTHSQNIKQKAEAAKVAPKETTKK
jgi:chaperonin GroES